MSSTDTPTTTTTSTSTSSSRSLPGRHGSTVSKAGRTHLDSTGLSAAYPLPVDLLETNRQIMFAKLTTTIYDTLILDRDLLQDRPPLRVLELGCDTGWWSAAAHQHFHGRGHTAEFVGMDLKAPLPGAETYYSALGMRWSYIQHDLNNTPWPVADASFDLVMARNITLALDGSGYSAIVQEYVRVLKPGGTLELWEHDTTIRALKKQDAAPDARGVYPGLDNAHFGPARNRFVAQYNAWLTAGLADVRLPTVPCSYIEAMFGGHLVESSDELDMVCTRRVAVPLGASEEEEEEEEEPDGEHEVIRRTALENFVRMVEAFEPLLRAASGLSQKSWDDWLNEARKDWWLGGGFASGECLELGAWSLRRKSG